MSNKNDNNKSATFWQAIATMVIWTMVTGGIALGGIFIAPQLGNDAMGFFFMLFGAAVLCTGFVWNWGRIEGDGRRRRKQKNQQFDYDYDYDEKRKRNRLSKALKTLSNDELVQLRERISRGEIDDEDLASVLGENV
ncbi:MAG: hypothetical protein Q9P44_13870 [Anaerolineae bacterium]|nr:hypothetical protein [Anaerolineae bacterium]